ncbi:vWA domain-containing protein [Arthrobacter sp. CG_A4]|uniref:vWA domain-containing protein n=1 Tax=Arthrobacter sp. CG_A4 TaxID=3071706 RepID=UPI002DF95895|nr:Ca-activated chloride channel family protein [Arthrobacter sp. CG_A4]
MTFNPVLPWWLMAALAAGIVLGICRVLFRSRQQLAPSGELRGWLFRGSLVLLLLLATARPGVPGGAVPAAASGLNVFFVVDTSSSIVAEDFSPAGQQGDGGTRFDGVRRDIRTIAEELAGARYSLISFDSESVVRMPLTADASALDTAVSVLGPQITSYSKGSSVTAARTVLTQRLAAARDSHPDRPRLVFYFGDGEQTSATAPQAMGLDAPLVSGGAVLGYGTAAGGRMKENSGDPARPAVDYIQDPGAGGPGGGAPGSRSQAAVSRIDEEMLRDIARGLSVPYVHRAAGDSAAPMLQKAMPGTLERTGEPLEGRTELYWLPALAAFLLALRETLLVFRQLRELRPVRSASPGTAPAAAKGLNT